MAQRFCEWIFVTALVLLCSNNDSIGVHAYTFGFIGDSLTCGLGENVDNATVCGAINNVCFPYWQEHRRDVLGFPHRLVSDLAANFSSRGCYPGATSRDVMMNGNVTVVANDQNADAVVILLGANDCGDGVQNTTAVYYDAAVTLVAQRKHGRHIFLINNPWDSPTCKIDYSFFKGTWNQWITVVLNTYQGLNGAVIHQLTSSWTGVTADDLCVDCAGHPLGVGYAIIAHNMAAEIKNITNL